MTVNATGTLAPRVKVTVGAEVSGRIDALYVDYNDHVVKGQKLAQINTEAIQAQLRQARATLAQSQATLIQTGATFKRYAALLKSNALSQQVYDTARGDYARAKAGVDQSSAQVQAYETQLTKATIYAPIDGVVLDRKVSVGQTVVAAFSTPELYTLASDSLEEAVKSIEIELKDRLDWFRKQGKLLEAQRLESRTKFDLRDDEGNRLLSRNRELLPTSVRQETRSKTLLSFGFFPAGLPDNHR